MFETRLVQMLWLRLGANSTTAGGVQTGVMDLLRKQYTGMLRAAPLEAAAYARIAAGGWWTEARLHERGLLAESTCWHCGREPGTMEHHIWHCTALWQHSDSTMFADTAHLVPSAEQAAEHGAYWLRGIPIQLAWPVLPPPADVVQYVGTFPPIGTLQQYCLCFDGSWGWQAQKPRLPRVGWAWALVELEAPHAVAAGCFGGMAGRQTVPRSEHRAASHALGALIDIYGEAVLDVAIQCYSDHLNLVKVVDKAVSRHGWPCTQGSSNHDLLCELRDVFQRYTNLQISKVKAHATHQYLSQRVLPHPLSAYVGNYAADELAKGHGSKLNELMADQVAEDRKAADRWQVVLQRIVHAYQLWNLHRPAEHDDGNEQAVAKPKLGTLCRQSAHRVCAAGGRLYCRTCQTFSIKGARHVREWLQSPCIVGHGDRFPHASHVVRVTSVSLMCVQCSASLFSIRSLVKPCKMQGIDLGNSHATHDDDFELELTDSPDEHTSVCVGNGHVQAQAQGSGGSGHDPLGLSLIHI